MLKSLLCCKQASGRSWAISAHCACAPNVSRISVSTWGLSLARWHALPSTVADLLEPYSRVKRAARDAATHSVHHDTADGYTGIRLWTVMTVCMMSSRHSWQLSQALLTDLLMPPKQLCSQCLHLSLFGAFGCCPSQPRNKE